MVIRQALDKTADCFRSAIVALTIAALGVSGANVAVAEQASEHNELAQGVDFEEAAGGMATGGQPWTEQAACMHSVMVLPGGNDQHRCKDQMLTRLEGQADFATLGAEAPMPATPSQVSWTLGRQLTLVGAKPSGTS